MYLTDAERLAIIAGCLGFLVLCFMIMVCKLSPYCCLHKHCPLRPKYDQEYNISSDAAKVKQYESTGQHEHLALTHPQVHRWRHQPGDSTSSEGEDGHNVDVQRVSVHNERSERSNSSERRGSSSDTPPGSDTGDKPASCLIKGDIEFSLFYPLGGGQDADVNQLHVWIRNVNNLIFRRREKVKLCVKVQLLKRQTSVDRILKLFQFLDPEEQDGNVEHETQTSLKSITKALEWQDPRRLPLGREECADRCVRLVCCIYDQFSQCTQLGQVMVELNNVSLGQDVVIQKPLSPAYQETKGEVLINLSYLPTAQKLVMTPVECRQLKLMETKYPSTIYMRVSMTSRGSYTKQRTRFRETQSRIVWNETVTFDLPNQQLGDVSIVITAKQSLTYPEHVKDITIGKLVLGAFNGPVKGQKQWKDMVANPRQVQTEWHSLH